MHKRARDIFIHILPVLLGILITIFLSSQVYEQMLTREQESSWEQLDSVALSVADKLTIRFQDNLNLMERVADAISLKDDLLGHAGILEYLNSVQESTMFTRLDILLPDNTIVHQDGEMHPMENLALPYEEAMAKGSHYSPRFTDKETGREVIYCVVPIITDGEPTGLLIGVVDCMGLADQIRTYSFDGMAKLFLLDRTDGNFLTDNWNEGLSNLHDIPVRQPMEGYEDQNFRQEILQGIKGQTAFYSRLNGRASYMSYVPVEGFPWSLGIVVQDEQVLENVRELQQSLIRIIIVELILLLSYLLWNIFVANMLVKQRENVQQMKLETATNEAKSLFLSSVSHDIRTPLNGILGMLDVIETHREDETQLDESLQKIRVSAEYLVTLADNVLDLNELEKGRTDMVDEPIDLRKLGPEMDILVQSRLKDSSVSCSIEYGELEHPYVLGSDGYLHRILSNLISNAMKYNKENGAIFVTIEEAQARQGSSLYRFTVRDTGIGMSEEFRRNMFQAFTQENSGARSKNTGHGLGLAIVDRMVRRMGGTITVESEKDVGSTFTVEIPFRWDPEGGRQESQLQSEDRDLTGANILLVEDNELNMEIARILLGDTGAGIVPAINGQLAVDAFAASEIGYFDAILMDIMMPEMDGCEATRVIRNMDRPDAATVPIIAMTASTFAEDVKRCRDAGMNEHVGKPLDMKVVIAMVSKFRRAYRNL